LKSSEWAKKYDQDNPNAKLRFIDLDDFLGITEFDDNYRPDLPCKHTVEYLLGDKNHRTDKEFKKVKNTKNLTKKFVISLSNIKKVTYWDLPEDLRKDTDLNWEQHAPNRCNKFCSERKNE